MTRTTVLPATPSDELEGRSDDIAGRLNGLRAGVMGANDGIVSTAGMVVGVAGAAVGDGALLAAGVSATIAGALSMGVGEYVSVASQRDALEANPRQDTCFEAEQLTNPQHAALASMVAFVLGALVPLIAILFSPRELAVPVTGAAVVVALVATGWISARLGGARPLPAVVRTVGGGLLAMVVTYAIGLLVGTWI